MLGTREQLKFLAASHESGQLVDLPILKGWRRQLVGQDLLDILSGDVGLSIDPSSGRIGTKRS